MCPSDQKWKCLSSWTKRTTVALKSMALTRVETSFHLWLKFDHCYPSWKTERYQSHPAAYDATAFGVNTSPSFSFSVFNHSTVKYSTAYITCSFGNWHTCAWQTKGSHLSALAQSCRNVTGNSILWTRQNKTTRFQCCPASNDVLNKKVNYKRIIIW